MIRNSPTSTVAVGLESDVDEGTEQFEGDPPLLTVAVERGRVLIDANDQADAVLQILVDECHPVANAEVGTTGELRGRSRHGEFDI